MNKRLIALSFVLVLALALQACSNARSANNPASTTQASASPAVPTSTGLVPVTCNGQTFYMAPQAGSTLGCDPNGQPKYFPVATVVVPPTAPVNAAPAAPVCNYDVVALDPGNGDQYTPTNVWVLQEDVDFGAKTIDLKVFYTTTPVLATINGLHHTNLWYYCDEAVAKAGANSQYRERLSESTKVGNPLYGMTVSVPVIEATSTSCNYDVVALDPGNGDQYTPTNVWVLQEDVDFGAKTIDLKVFYTTTPVLATINGLHHTNLWYYCDEAVAKAGANSQYRERLSESTKVGNPLYGMTVSAPFGQ